MNVNEDFRTFVPLFVVFTLCIGGIVLVVVRGRDVMDEYYEYEIRQKLQGGM